MYRLYIPKKIPSIPKPQPNTKVMIIVTNPNTTLVFRGEILSKWPYESSHQVSSSLIPSKMGDVSWPLQQPHGKILSNRATARSLWSTQRSELSAFCRGQGYPVFGGFLERWHFNHPKNTPKLPSLKLTVRTWKWWCPIGISFSRGLFSDATLLSGSVDNIW